MPSILTTLAALAFAGISTTAFIVWIAERSRPDTAGDGTPWGDMISVPREMRTGSRNLRRGEGPSELGGSPSIGDSHCHRDGGVTR